jgi:hypothetical protein
VFRYFPPEHWNVSTRQAANFKEIFRIEIDRSDVCTAILPAALYRYRTVRQPQQRKTVQSTVILLQTCRGNSNDL